MKQNITGTKDFQPAVTLPAPDLVTEPAAEPQYLAPVMRWARETGPRLTPATRAVLKELAAWSNPQGHAAVPQSLIAQATELSTRSVRRAMRTLEAAGLVANGRLAGADTNWQPAERSAAGGDLVESLYRENARLRAELSRVVSDRTQCPVSVLLEEERREEPIQEMDSSLLVLERTAQADTMSGPPAQYDPEWVDAILLEYQDVHQWRSVAAAHGTYRRDWQRCRQDVAMWSRQREKEQKAGRQRR